MLGNLQGHACQGHHQLITHKMRNSEPPPIGANLQYDPAAARAREAVKDQLVVALASIISSSFKHGCPHLCLGKPKQCHGVLQARLKLESQ